MPWFAQEFQTVMPEAVLATAIFYDKLGMKLQTYDQWVASGALVPSGAAIKH